MRKVSPRTSFDKFDARSARVVSTANCLCYSHKRNCRNELRTASSTLGVCVGARRLYAEYSVQNMAATAGKTNFMNPGFRFICMKTQMSHFHQNGWMIIIAFMKIN